MCSTACPSLLSLLKEGRNTVKTKYLEEYCIHLAPWPFQILFIKECFPLYLLQVYHTVLGLRVGRGDTALCLEKAYIVVLGNPEYELWV